MRPVLECWTTLSWLAAAVPEIGIGTLVTRSSLRSPVVLAHMAATVAAMAPGRLTVGIGSGDALSRDENRAFGIPYASGGDRIAQLEDTVGTVGAILREHLGPTARGPRLETAPPLWVAGRSDEVLRVAGRHGDGYNQWQGSPADLAAAGTEIRAHSGARRVELTWAGAVAVGAGPPQKTGGRIGGEPDEVADALIPYIEAGATHLVCVVPNAADPAVPGLIGAVGDLVRRIPPGGI